MTFDQAQYDFENPDPNGQRSRFKSLRYDPEMERLKSDLIEINQWKTSKVQKLYHRAKNGMARGSQAATIELRKIIEKYKVKYTESGDPYMPYATSEQISSTSQGIHLCNQVNNEQMLAGVDEFQANTLVLGRPKGGKSSAIFYWLSQMMLLPILIMDIKNIWRHRAEDLNAKVISPPFYFDLEPPDGIPWYNWIFSVLDGLAIITGLQYGVVPFIEAARIALQQREKYIERTQQNTSLSLMDIYYALDFVNRSDFKRDYILSCKAALKLIIGPNEEFSTRKGLPLHEILNGRYIIECCYLSMIQCRFLAFYLLNYLLQASYRCLEHACLTRLVFIDDSSAFINRPDNAFGSSPKTGFWGHILSKLRGSGTGLIFADQLVQPIFDDVKQLCTNWIIVGGLRDTQNYNEVMAAMNLTREQADYIGKMKTQECIAYFPGLYHLPVHGLIPDVSSIAEGQFNE